jgi:hypothetical protein
MIRAMPSTLSRLLKRARWVVVATACTSLPADAGPLGLPIPNPGTVVRNTLETVRNTVDKVTDTVTGTVEQTLPELQLDPAGRPIDPALFEHDENGARIVRGVVIAIGLSERGREAAESLDIDIDDSEELDPLDLEVTKLELPPGLAATAAIEALRTADPTGAYDFLHIYNPSGATAFAAATAPALARVPRDAIEVGMIDSGIDDDHVALRDADITVKVTTAQRSRAKPTAHGTAVASLLVGEDRDFRGYLPGAKLYAADAFGGSPTGGTAGDIARAVAWLVENKVPVVNISVTGPKNALLEAAVRAAIARGHIIVAAVGNDGPAAGVRYPAAYDGVVAVTAVDERGRLQLDANRGPAIAFAARGVNVRAAQLSDAYEAVTGTSFASPVVAARFAELMSEPDVIDAEQARAMLIAAARKTNDAHASLTGHGILEMAPSTSESAAAR